MEKTKLNPNVPHARSTREYYPSSRSQRLSVRPQVEGLRGTILRGIRGVGSARRRQLGVAVGLADTDKGRPSRLLGPLHKGLSLACAPGAPGHNARNIPLRERTGSGVLATPGTEMPEHRHPLPAPPIGHSQLPTLAWLIKRPPPPYCNTKSSHGV